MADRARNANGFAKAATLNVMTPIRPGCTWVVRLMLWVLRWFTTPPDLPLLSFVHWVVVPRRQFPRLGQAQPEERLKYDYLFFFSSFVGPWGPYIDAFADVLARALDLVWFWTVGYPGANPVSGLKAHITWNRIESDHFYSAYPGASVRDVRSAIVVEQALNELATLAATLPNADFATEYDRVLLRLANHLGALGTLPN